MIVPMTPIQGMTHIFQKLHTEGLLEGLTFDRWDNPCWTAEELETLKAKVIREAQAKSTKVAPDIDPVLPEAPE